MEQIIAIYKKWYWMQKFALVENNCKMFNLCVAQGARMERMYGDIFAEVRTEIARKFIHTKTGWACKFNA